MFAIAVELRDLVTRRTDGDPHHLAEFALVRILLPQHDHATLRNVLRLRKIGPVRYQPSEGKTENPLADRRQVLVVFPVLDVFLANGKHRGLLYLPHAGKNNFRRV